jgi:hypothetical protein
VCSNESYIFYFDVYLAAGLENNRQEAKKLKLASLRALVIVLRFVFVRFAFSLTEKRTSALRLKRPDDAYFEDECSEISVANYSQKGFS